MGTPLRGGVASGVDNVKGGTPLRFPATLSHVTLTRPLHIGHGNEEKAIFFILVFKSILFRR